MYFQFPQLTTTCAADVTALCHGGVYLASTFKWKLLNVPIAYILLWHMGCPNGQTGDSQPTGQDTMLATMWSVVAIVTTVHLCICDCGRGGKQVKACDLPMLSTGDATPGVCGSDLNCPVQKRHEYTGEDWWRLTKVVVDVEHLIDEKKLREMWLFSLENRRPRGISSIYINIREGSKEDGARLFSVIPVTGSDVMGTNWITGGPVWTSVNTFFSKRETRWSLEVPSHHNLF